MKKLAILAALLLSACAADQREVIHLRNDAGTQVTCGPYGVRLAVEMDTESAALAAVQLRTCVADYQKAGYQRYQPSTK